MDTRAADGVYDLYAVINHHGESMNSGHYTAYCRNPVDGVWRHFDDTKVTAVEDEKQLVTNGAYILFYEVVTTLRVPPGLYVQCTLVL